MVMISNSVADILLVENDPAEAAVIRSAILQNKSECKIHWVKEGEDALSFIFNYENGKLQIHVPRLIILSLNIPHVSGLEVLQKIKAHPSTQHVMIISLLAAPAEIEVFSDAIKAGSNICMIKSPDCQVFVRKLKEELGYYWKVFE
jgi:two-component system response regulator